MAEKEKADALENDAFSSALGNILGDPEMMSMISSMAERLKGSSAAEPSVHAPLTEAKPNEAVGASTELSGALGTLAPLLAQSFGRLSREDDERACLLRALKPYLNPGRCEAIEHIIKFSKISDVLKNLS